MLLALSPSTPGLGANDLIELSVLAERLGYSQAWVAEVAGPEAFSLLAGIAAKTDKLDLGVAVVPAASRSPALLAMAAGTVSQIAEGRDLWLGIGSSSEFIVGAWHGAEFTPPVARVRETVEAVRALLGGSRGYEGEYRTVSRFALGSPPVGEVRVAIGALGPRMLALAGEIGDGACLNLMPPRVVSAQRAAIEAGAASAGRSLPDHFTVMARLHVVPSDDAAAGREAVRQGFGPYIAQPVYNAFVASFGYSEEAEAIKAGFAAGDRAAVSKAMHDRLVDDLALVGSEGAIRQRLEEYEASGLDVAALSIIGDASSVSDLLTALAPAPP